MAGNHNTREKVFFIRTGTDHLYHKNQEVNSENSINQQSLMEGYLIDRTSVFSSGVLR
jgi:hypothetical protein